MFGAGLAIGIYLGIGCGYAMWALADVGFDAGYRLIWRVPALIVGWPAAFVVALGG